MAKRHTKAARAAQRGVGVQPSTTTVTDDQVARARAQMVVERQSELDQVLDRHDDMVRVLPCGVSDGLGC